MKTKSLLFILAAAILLSFTVIARQSQGIPSTETATASSPQSAPNAGFAMEDRDQW